MPKYANPIIDRLDPFKFISYRLFREDCTLSNDTFVKDLSVLGRDLKNTMILDNCPGSYSFHPYNGLPSNTWIDDEKDNQLYDLWRALKVLAKVEDVRTTIRKIVRNHKIDYSAIKELEEQKKDNSEVNESKATPNHYVESLERLATLRKEIESKFNTLHGSQTVYKVYESTQTKNESTKSELKNTIEKDVKKPLNDTVLSHVRRRTIDFAVFLPSTTFSNTEVKSTTYKSSIQDLINNYGTNNKDEKNIKNEYLTLTKNSNKTKMEHLTPHYSSKDSFWFGYSGRKLYRGFEDKNEKQKYVDEVDNEYKNRIKEMIDKRYENSAVDKVSGLFSIEKKKGVEEAYKTSHQNKESKNHLINATRERRHLFLNESKPIKFLNNGTNDLCDALSMYERKYYSTFRGKDMIEGSRDLEYLM